MLGFKSNPISQERPERILDVCKRMDMPEDFLETFRDTLSDANYVHFGFEDNKRTCVYKAYLEFSDRIDRQIASHPSNPHPFLMHLGFKWDTSDNTKRALASYTWYPLLSLDETLTRSSNILDPCNYKPLLDIVKGIMDIASRRAPHQDILYLEVSEDDNPRRSFDINIYRANLQLREVYPLFLKLCSHYSVPPDDFHMVYRHIKTRRLGHLSAGIDREGEDFITVYYGLQGYALDHIQDNESEHRPLEGTSLPKRRPDRTPSVRAPLCTKARTHEKASLLLRLIEDLNVQFGLEQSFKILHEAILGDRFLLAFKKSSIGQEPHQRIVDICRRINMPRDFLEPFRDSLPKATIVLFGFEENERTSVFKAYLEFGDRFGELLKDNPHDPEPFLIHLGFKWDASDNSRCSVARYTCFPSFTVAAMLERISGAFFRNGFTTPLAIVSDIVRVASRRMADDEFLYFEAEEDANPRRSFDINMYRANLQLAELYPVLLKLCQHYSIPSDDLHALYEPVRSQVFGHVSGGVDREARDFITVYFGEKGSSR